MKIKTIALFAMLFAIPASSASAVTVSKLQTVASTSTSSVLHKVDYRGKKKNFHKPNRYKAGQRYNKAPSNWHRHQKRPGDWQRRGCITVGALWWCP